MRIMRYSSEIIKFILILLSIFVTLLFSACAFKPTAQSYIDKGLVCLSDNNYEEAIIAFSSAIEIEPNNITAYQRRAEAYLSSDQYELALADYDYAINVDPNNSDLYDAIISLYLQQNDLENATLYVGKKRDSLGEASLSESDKSMIAAKETIEELGQACEQDDANSIDEIFESSGFSFLVQFARDSGHPYLVSNGSKTMGIYITSIGMPMVYYGTISNGNRTGYASWYFKNYAAYGTWENDYPNGEFTVNSRSGELSNIQGNVINGLWDGDAQFIISGNVWHAKYNQGIIQIQETITYPDGRVMEVFMYSDNGHKGANRPNTNPAGILGYSIQLY